MSFVTKANHKRVLYVGGLDKAVSEEVLTAAFVPFGPIKDAQVPMDYTGKTPKNKGHGFVEFVSEEDAKEAMDNMDDSELYGKVIKVTIAKPSSAIRPETKRAVWDEHLDEDHVLADDKAAP
ncbi:peptidyl-prolyl cis-trans isomerase E [Achlya hypogyna]|uniref:Peptidyl-prolyl cis-trans isomerase E n=1 Tax=Achlya hypogyna TaxID=1202772 RepID=A0A1V9YLN5_ACHHY|nr:peptidyl-prolyl cis-trans isomerase E [Achlya hypogyna]